jgi:hypothetical protein
MFPVPAIIPSPYSYARREVLVRLPAETSRADVERGYALARALKARWSRRASGFIFTPYRAHKWRLLYVAGFSVCTEYLATDCAIPRYYQGGAGPFTLYQATALANLPLDDGSMKEEKVAIAPINLWKQKLNGAEHSPHDPA